MTQMDDINNGIKPNKEKIKQILEIDTNNTNEKLNNLQLMVNYPQEPNENRIKYLERLTNKPKNKEKATRLLKLEKRQREEVIK